MKRTQEYTISGNAATCARGYENTAPVVNPEDYGWTRRAYIVHMGLFNWFAVYAGCEGDALDAVTDYCVDEGYKGLYLDRSDPAQAEDIAELEKYEQDISAGNCGWILDSGDIHIQEIEKGV